MIASLAASTLAFFAAGYFARRWLDDNDLPKGATRGALIFSIALAAAYGAGWIVEHLV
jgi:hypothetical protein